jgi:hypothetical protein
MLVTKVGVTITMVKTCRSRSAKSIDNEGDKVIPRPSCSTQLAQCPDHALAVEEFLLHKARGSETNCFQKRTYTADGSAFVPRITLMRTGTYRDQERDGRGGSRALPVCAVE